MEKNVREFNSDATIEAAVGQTTVSISGFVSPWIVLLVVGDQKETKSQRDGSQ